LEVFPDELIFWNSLADSISRIFPEFVSANFVSLNFATKMSSKHLTNVISKFNSFKREIGDGSLNRDLKLKIPCLQDIAVGKKIIALENQKLDSLILKVLNLIEDLPNNVSFSSICEFKVRTSEDVLENLVIEPTLAVSLTSRQPSIDDLNTSSIRFSNRRRRNVSQAKNQARGNEPVDISKFNDLMTTIFNFDINIPEFHNNFLLRTSKLLDQAIFDESNVIKLKMFEEGKTLLEWAIQLTDHVVFNWYLFKDHKICEPAFTLLSLDLGQSHDVGYEIHKCLALCYFTIHLGFENWIASCKKYLGNLEIFIQFNHLPNNLQQYCNEFPVFYHHIHALISPDDDDAAYKHLLMCKKSLIDRSLYELVLPFDLELSITWIDCQLSRISFKPKVFEMDAMDRNISWFKINFFNNQSELHPTDCLTGIPDCYRFPVLLAFIDVSSQFIFHSF
jgi:hypothetical protein